MHHNAENGTTLDLVNHRLEIAREDLKSAKILFEAEEYRGANNRAYYAIYHALNAVHAIKRKGYKKHKDAIANFNKEYVKTGIFPREIGRKISEAVVIRHASDYDDFYIASKDESQRQVDVAEEFLRMAEKYCKDMLIGKKT